MESKSNISSYRDKLDETLASEELKNEKRLRELVKNQILQSSQVDFREYVDEVAERRTKEVSNFLDMLRSASIDDSEKLKSSNESYGSWKVKQDTEEFRVMYREGPEGTPLHTLLVEGYVDGPVDVCLCISWETALFRKWWPQSSVPSFKITSSKCLQRVRIGEQISLVRMKVSWPLSAREAIIHFFEFDYFQDGLVVVLLNSVDVDTISKRTHGFDSDGIPDTDNVVRIDVVGGFALQKVTENRSYFRTIANMDIKLDVIPPSFINFVARQLIGSGFKLYKKEVASVSRGDEDFAKVLKDPQYERIREALYSDSTPLKKMKAEDIKQEDDKVVKQGYHSDDRVPKPDNEDTRETTSDQLVLVREQPLENDDHVRVEEEVHSEIEEIGEEDAEGSKHKVKVQNNQISENFNIERKKVPIRPELEKALNTLDKAIEIIRENKSNIEHNVVPSITTEKPNIEKEEAKASSTVNAETSNQPRNSCGSLSSRRSGSSSYAREASKVAPATPDQFIHSTGHTQHVSDDSSSVVQTTPPSVEKMSVEDNTSNKTIDFIHGESMIKNKSKKFRLCCLHNIY